jgi:hypothetical protein
LQSIKGYFQEDWAYLHSIFPGVLWTLVSFLIAVAIGYAIDGPIWLGITVVLYCWLVLGVTGLALPSFYHWAASGSAMKITVYYLLFCILAIVGMPLILIFLILEKFGYTPKFIQAGRAQRSHND